MRVYSADNRLIGEFGEMRRTPLPIQDAPPLLIRAIIAAEDNRFFEHHGVDVKGLLRAVSELVTSGQIRTGGSTITMQVAKNFFLSSDRTFSRKFSEILLALQIESRLSKTEILELYINKIYLGNRAYGVQAAAQMYYGQDIQDLGIAEWAMIAGLPKAPSTFNPLANPERAMIRRNWIIGRMFELNYIDEAAFQFAQSQPNTAAHHGTLLDMDAPYAAEMARQEAISRFGLAAYTRGLIVHTTIDSRLQSIAQAALRRGLMTYDWRHGYRQTDPRLPPADSPEASAEAWLIQLKGMPNVGELLPAVVVATEGQHLDALTREGELVRLEWEQGLSSARRHIDSNQRGPAPAVAADIAQPGQVIRLWKDSEGLWQLRQIPRAQAALVALSPDNGAIIAITGGFDFRQSKFNRATQASRQPGSNFKPFIYSAALEHGFTAASIINDAPLVFNDRQLEDTWRPENSSGRFNGPTTLRNALIHSRNLVSIRLLKALGINTAIEYVGRFGFDTQALPKDLSLALGTHAVPPLDIVTAYASLANGGYRVKPFLVHRIEDINGDVLFEAMPATVCRSCEAAETDATTEADTLEALLASEDTPQRPAAPRIMDPRAAYIIDSILQDVVRKGTAQKARALQRNDIAGKTGTTNGPTDAWFSGYTPSIVTTVWLGFDQNQVLGRNEYGGTAALPIWMEFMEAALAGTPDTPRPQPAGLVTVRIDPATGQRAQAGQPGAVFEIFMDNHVPEASPVTGSGLPDESTPEEALPWELF
jgi:penicillin-binding protein 1A